LTENLYHDVSRHEPIQPKDLITSSATIVGLILAALGVLIALAGEQYQAIVRNFAFVFIIVIVFFVIAVIITALSSLLKKYRIWQVGLAFYVIGWSFFGGILILIFIGYAYGIEVFQIQMPEFDVELSVGISSAISSILGLVTGIVSVILTSRRRKEIETVSANIEVKQYDLEKERKSMGVDSSSNLRNSVILLRSDVEKEIQQIFYATEKGIRNIGGPRHLSIRMMLMALVERKLIDEQLARSILFLYAESSKVVHGQEISSKTLSLIRDLGVKALIRLRQIRKEIR